MIGILGVFRTLTELQRRLLAVAFASLGTRVGTAALGAITTGVLIRSLGSTEFGAYALILSIAGFASFLDQGLAVGVRTLVAERRSVLDDHGVASAVRAGFRITLVSCSLVVSILLTSTIVTYFLAEGDHRRLILLGTSFLILFVATLPGLVSLRALEGAGYAPLAAAVPLMTAVVVVLFTLLGNSLDLNLAFFVFVAALGGAPAYVLCFLVVRKRLLTGVKNGVDRPDFGKLWASSWPMVIVSIMLSVSYSADPIIVSALLGLDATAEYTLAARISQVSMLLLTSTFPVIWTHYASLSVSGNRLSYASWRQTSILFAGAGCLVGLPVCLFGPWATRVWSGGSIQPPSQIFYAFAVWGVVLACHLPSAGLMTAAKDLRFQATTSSVMALANIPLSIALTGMLGLAGPVWASAFALAGFHAFPLLVRSRMRLLENRRDERIPTASTGNTEAEI